jgi:glycosyltransferase involved in cell wall biosynthesis
LHPDDLAKGIINMLKNDKLREVTGKRAKEYALRLTPKSRAEALLRIFEATIKNDKKNLILK